MTANLRRNLAGVLLLTAFVVFAAVRDASQRERQKLERRQRRERTRRAVSSMLEALRHE